MTWFLFSCGILALFSVFMLLKINHKMHLTHVARMDEFHKILVILLKDKK